MGNGEHGPERGPMRLGAGAAPPAVADARHSIQESGHQPADLAAYEPSDAPRRRPGRVDGEAQ
jgi:hypothetical protein